MIVVMCAMVMMIVVVAKVVTCRSASVLLQLDPLGVHPSRRLRTRHGGGRTVDGGGYAVIQHGRRRRRPDGGGGGLSRCLSGGGGGVFVRDVSRRDPGQRHEDSVTIDGSAVGRSCDDEGIRREQTASTLLDQVVPVANNPGPPFDCRDGDYAAALSKFN